MFGYNSLMASALSFPSSTLPARAAPSQKRSEPDRSEPDRGGEELETKNGNVVRKQKKRRIEVKNDLADLGLDPEVQKMLEKQADAISGAALCGSTISSYDSNLAIVERIEERLGRELIPLTVQNATILFSYLSASKEAESHKDERGKIRWSWFAHLRSAICKHAILTKAECVFLEDTPAAKQFQDGFWVGLKKTSSHLKKKKATISLEQLVSVIQQLREEKTFNAQRRAAILIFGFFGVRRNSESMLVLAEDFVKRDNGIEVGIRRMKNDVLAEGHKVAIPSLTSGASAGFCPATIIEEYLAQRREFLDEKNMESDWAFFTLDGKNKGGSLSYDSIRKEITNAAKAAGVIDNGVVSLRKSGASFYANFDTSKKLTKVLGGWKSDDVIDDVYAPTSAASLLKTTRSAIDQGLGKISLDNALSVLEKAHRAKKQCNGALQKVANYCGNGSKDEFLLRYPELRFIVANYKPVFGNNSAYETVSNWLM
jgi:hypothetical protein